MAVLPTGIGPVTGGYQISRSLRFNSADSAYLNRTPASAGNRKIWTWSGWVKRSTLGTVQGIFDAYSGGLDFATVFFNTDNTIYFYSCYNSGSFVDYDFTTTAVFRDVGAWYHIVLVLNTVSATQADRFIVYVNGVRQAGTNPSGAFGLNEETYINSTVSHRLGSRTDGSYYSNGYMTEVNFINGQALTPSSFGQTNASTGVWEPLAYTGTYGTNGFYLNFSDNSGTTSTTLGKDYSGNGNNWTPNNFSVTAGAGNDSLVDTPTSYGTDTGVGGEVRGNYCTLNPLIIVPAGTVSNGNLDYNRGSTASHGSAAASFTLPTTGKWYWEVRACKSANNEMIGVANIQNNPQLPATGSEIGTGSRGDYGYRSDGNKYNNGSQGSYGATYTSGDIIGVAWDSDAGTLVFYKNGSSQGTAFSSITQSNGKFAPAVSSAETSPDSFNFGQRAFSYTAPSGFKALCTQNLPTPTIGATSTTQANDYFDISLWTGTGASQTITNSGGFQPDFVWGKIRSGADYHVLTDAVRGNTKFLKSNTTDAEITQTQNITSFNSNGFTLGTNTDLNRSTYTFVGWQWKANGAGSSNTAGTITSTVSANTTSGFSIVTYTGTGANATVGHGIGTAPQMVICKNRSVSAEWYVYHASLGTNKAIFLEQTAAASTSNLWWNNTAPTSTVFSLGDQTGNNGSGNSIVAYCFAPVAGYSAFGSYTGNGSATDGVFVYTGFRPRWILVKNSGAVGSWCIYDAARNTYNLSDARLNTDNSNAEAVSSTQAMDIVSNGFKLKSSNTDQNGSSNTYIYACFAEHPFKYSLAR